MEVCKVCSNIGSYLIKCGNCNNDVCSNDCIMALFNNHHVFKPLCYICFRPIFDNVIKISIYNSEWLLKYKKYYENTYDDKSIDIFLQKMWRKNCY